MLLALASDMQLCNLQQECKYEVMNYMNNCIFVPLGDIHIAAVAFVN